MSHMFFGQEVHLFMNGLMATHPPLEERIRSIDPSWDGKFRQVSTTLPSDVEEILAKRPRAGRFPPIIPGMPGQAIAGAAAAMLLTALWGQGILGRRARYRRTVLPAQPRREDS
jgi:hypothetical protein